MLLAVTGPNGSGKSSLLRLLAGLLRPQSGGIHFEGLKDDQASAHYLGHADALKPALTLRETLNFWAALYRRDTASDPDVGEASAAVGLRHALDLRTGTLSAGQRRRAGLARLILPPRPLWLLDEPGAALDRDGEAILGGMMHRHLDAGGLIVAATHQALPVAPHATVDLART